MEDPKDLLKGLLQGLLVGFLATSGFLAGLALVLSWFI